MVGILQADVQSRYVQWWALRLRARRLRISGTKARDLYRARSFKIWAFGADYLPPRTACRTMAEGVEPET